MLEACQLECTRGDHLLFSNLNFCLQDGELLHVRGSNGSGKTTLLRILCGLTTPTEGKVTWCNNDIAHLREEYYSHLTYIGHLNGIKDELSGLENLQIMSKLSALDVLESDMLRSLQKMGLAKRVDLPSKFLSQGQKRRVTLAKLLLSQSKLWILDEPFTALDVRAIDLLQTLIGKHLDNKGMVVFTTHQEVDIPSAAVRQINLDT